MRRQLHRGPIRVGTHVRLPDGRRFVVFRSTGSSRPSDGRAVTLAVWFHLRWVPAGSRRRRLLFERESILNTVLFAGAPGYRAKLWLVDPISADFAGLYSWNGPQAAQRYAQYITAVLRPLSVPGSVGYELIDESRLDVFLDDPEVTG